MSFLKLSRQKQEAIMIVEIMTCLQQLGGSATRDELIAEIRMSDNAIPEDYFDKQVISKRSGKAYRPSAYVFNFSIKHLLISQYIIKPQRAFFQLTEKGIAAEINANFSEIVAEETKSYWDDKSKNRKDKTDAHIAIEEDSENTWRDELKQALSRMHPKKFESFCRALIRKMGVKMDEKIGVSYVADGGLDGFGYITGTNDFRTSRVAIQAKRWQGNVSSPEIDKFRGAMDKFNAEYGIFITTSNFTRDAIAAARVGTRVITLINGDDICDLVARYQLFVTEVKTYELGEFYLTETDEEF